MPQEFKPRITVTTAWLMISTAFFYDVLQALLAFIFMGWIIIPVSFLTFYIWFKIHDVGFLERFGAKKIMAYIVIPIIEIATLGVAPGITIATAITISIVMFEDKLIKNKVITREDLRRLEKFVLKTGRTHGFDSPEFNQAISDSLRDKIKERYAPGEKAA